MKKTIVWACSAALLVSAAVAGAGTVAPQQGPQDFDTKKANILQRMDDREKKMNQKHQEGRACIQNAQNDNDLKACREKMRMQHKEKRDKFREMRDQRKQQPQ